VAIITAGIIVAGMDIAADGAITGAAQRTGSAAAA
jgi:hypothetical protein